MRAAGITLGLVLVLSASAGAEPGRATAAEIDLGTRTLGHREIAIGPMHGAVGIAGRVMVGTYWLPWGVALVDRFSVIPNGFVKAELVRYRQLSLAVHSALFYASLEDLDGDGLDARAIVWPTRLALGTDWGRRWATTFEATGVFARGVADNLDDQDTRIYGVAVANTFHVAVVGRYQWRPKLALWARGRLVLAHAPILVDGSARLSDSARVELRARANAADLSAVGSASAGVVWTRRRLAVRAGVGYGHWILPWIQLPIGRNLPTAELNAYWRF